MLIPGPAQTSQIPYEFQQLQNAPKNDGDVATWNEAAGRWEPQAATGGGGISNPVTEDLAVTGDGTAGVAPATPGVYLGAEVGGNGNGHMEIVSPTNGVAYQDFTTVGVDYKVRQAWDDIDKLYILDIPDLGHTLTADSAGFAIDGALIQTTHIVPGYPFFMSIPLAWNTSSIRNGIKIATIQAHIYVRHFEVFITNYFDGSTPQLTLGWDQTSSAASSSEKIVNLNLDTGDPTLTPGFGRAPQQLDIAPFYLVGNDTTDIWARIDNGSGGDPGNSRGTLQVILQGHYWT